MRWKVALRGLVLLAGAWSATSCAPNGFAAETLIATVRILSSASDPGYAQPGSSVGVQVLAYDGRASQAEPMTVYWLPFVCEDPADDAYYACFTPFEGGSDGGTPDVGDGGAPVGLGALKPGVDLTPFLPSGSSYEFQMPADVVAKHLHVNGSQPQYGLAILFNAACAGHLELLPPNPGNQNPQQVPLGCFDKNENQLGPDDWVLGFTRVYAFDPGSAGDGGTITNANPAISYVDVQGNDLAVTPSPNATMAYTTQAISTPHCSGNCPAIPIGPVVPSTSWEATQNVDSNGNPLHEEIWADFYSTFGSFSGDASLLYDATKGAIDGGTSAQANDPSSTDNQFTPPSTPGSGFIWMVIHDNRGGASWVTVPVTVQ